MQQGEPQNGKTGDFYLWKTLTFPITVAEGEGARTVVISQTTGAGPNVDAVALSERGAAVSFAAPEITSDAAFTVSENAAEVGVITASDLDGDAIAYAIAEGGDGALFEIDPATGALSFVEAPDFEAPASAAGANTYTLTVTASDGGEPVEQVVTVTVEDVAEDAPRPADRPDPAPGRGPAAHPGRERRLAHRAGAQRRRRAGRGPRRRTRSSTRPGCARATPARATPTTATTRAISSPTR